MTDTSTNRVLRLADDLSRFGATPSRARKIVKLLRALVSERDELREKITDEMDDWDGEGSCPKCQGDWCDPEGGCVHDD
ncbi:MAG: hypothetical protein GYB50_03855 [Rhodobacteraceae bacterium]|nr:hypothetical protein [Paracoccaceae bacterium]